MAVQIGAKPESSFDNPLGLLNDCHRRIEHFLAVMLEVAARLRGRELDAEHRRALAAAVQYFERAAPRHTQDEEESLFPRMRAAKGMERDAIRARLAQLQQDHVVAERAQADALSLCHRWLASGALDDAAASGLLQLLVQLQDLYRDHIASEDGEVFPAARELLSPSELDAVGREMAARRGITPLPPG